MKIRHLLNRVLAPGGYEIIRKKTAPGGPVYDQDGLRSIHNHDFMRDAAFQQAYKRGVAVLGEDRYQWHWRVHVGLWAACCAVKLRGDFVECGVNYGFLSSAIMDYLDWNSRDKTFYLLDTFSGLDERYISEDERKAGVLETSQRFLQSGHYVSRVETVQANFSQWKNVALLPERSPKP